MSTDLLDFGATGTQISLRVFNDGGEPLAWSAQSSWGWISVTPSSGSVAPGSSTTLTARVSRGSLSVGTHQGTIGFTSNGGSSTVKTVATVTGTDAAKFRVSTTTLDFGTSGTELSLRVFNDGSGPLDWSAQPSWGWLSVTPSTGNLAAGSSTAVTVRVSRSGLSGGSHEGSLSFTSSAGSATVGAKVTVVSPPKLRVSPTSLDFGPISSSLTFKIFNDGGEPLDWTAQSNAEWLTPSPSSGRVPAGSSQEVVAQASRSTLTPGDHVGSLQVGSNGGSATIAASLRVTSTGNSGEVNVRDFGARGDGVTDDIKAFDAALAALGSAGGTLFIPAGTYILKPYRMGALEILARSNITIAGEGIERSIIRLAPVTYVGATHGMLVANASGITMRDFTLDGNKPNASYNDQQSHGVEIRNSSDLRFERVRLMNLYGDGIRMVGRYRDIGSWVERVVIEDSRFEYNGRSGVGMQRAVRDVRIANNTFEMMSDQSLSSEPGGPELGDVAPRDIVMEGNVIRARGNLSVSLEGISPTDPARRLVFRNNRVENGEASFRKVDDLLIEGNVFIGSGGGPALQLPANVSNARIVNNEISGSGGIEGLIQVRAEYDARAFPSHITVSNNRIQAGRAGQTAILVRDALEDVTVTDNEIDGAAGRNGIYFETRLTRGSPRAGFTVRGNVIHNFDRGIAFGTDGDPFGAVVVEANAIDHDQEPPAATVGILFARTGPYEDFANVVGNTFGAGIKTETLVLSK